MSQPVFNDITQIVIRENNFTPDMLWSWTPKGYRFAPSDHVVRTVTARVSGISSECLGAYLGSLNTSPLAMSKTIKSCDFTSFRDLLCATTVQVVLAKLKQRIPAPEFAVAELAAV
jgi:hypothetical protein